MADGKDILTRKDLKVLVQSGHELASQITLDVLLQNILNKASELTDSPDSSIILYNETRDTLFFAAASGSNTEKLLNEWGEFSEQQVPIQGSKAGQVFLSKKSVVVHALGIDPDHYKGVDKDIKKNTESMVCVPLIVSGKSLGVIQLLNKRSGNYSRRDQIILEHFAVQAAVAIRNARLFVDLLAHMGLYSSLDESKGPLELMDELDKPAHSEILTVMFPDMRGFTQLCQLLNSPTLVQERLKEFISMLSEAVLRHNGMVNKFLGDGLMALFRGGNHAKRAIRCAFDMLERFDKMRHQWDDESNLQLNFLDIGVGIATDAVIVGTIGSKRVRDFTAIGNAINLAAAFEYKARNGTRILVDQKSFNSAKDIITDFEGPEDFELKKPGQSLGHTYKMYHLKKLSFDAKPCAFISHSQEDHEFVETHLLNPLKNAGIGTWYSKNNIKIGTAWVTSITEGLRKCQWMIVVVSKNSTRSEWVKKEIELAMSDSTLRFNDKIVPVILDNTDPKEVYDWLAPLQAISVSKNEDFVQLLLARILEL